jgi:perosamine synthetase
MVHKQLPYGHHWIEEDDIQAVVGVLRSDWITQGEMIEQFERAVAEYCQAEYAVAVSSATAGLHLASLVAGVGPGCDLITSPLTFVASANIAFYSGAQAYFSDIDPRTYNLCPTGLQQSLDEGRLGETPAVLVPVHFAGQCCDMESLAEIAKGSGMRIIEDASHAMGGSWVDREGRERRIGSCSHSDMAVFSFHPAKHITTGEGGVVLTNDVEYYQALRSLRNHGITKDPDKIDTSVGPWFYEMQSLGYNYRITDFQCALGMSQLKKLDFWILRRRAIARMYDEAFVDMDRLITPHQAEYSDSAYHLYPIQVDGGDKFNLRRRIFERLHERGIGVQVHYIPVHMQPYYKHKLGYEPGDFPEAKSYYERAFSLPIFPKMTDRDVQRVISELKNALVEVD